MGEWLGLIGALAGAAIGGIITYRVSGQQHRHERKIENQRRLIVSYEAMHELLSTISSQASTLNMGVIGDLGYNARLKGDILKEKVQLDRLRMLVDFYAPSLQKDVKSLTEQFALVIYAVTETVLQKDRNDEWKTKTVKSAALASIEIARVAQDAQTKLAGLIRPVLSES
jgi:hypothetical protein